MNTRTMKILTTVFSALIMVAMLGTVVFAAPTAPTPNSVKDNVSYEGTAGITELGGKIMGIIQTVGVVVAVVILMVLGIKYMMGSAEEKAEYKKTMMPYLLGAVLIFGASTIANMVYNFANGLNA
ncbi:MAG: TrbC/VirB2 family protein [Clostridia bacterium]|nr:TrbC/VirB2 family protein [Clostridia bacterium]